MATLLPHPLTLANLLMWVAVVALGYFPIALVLVEGLLSLLRPRWAAALVDHMPAILVVCLAVGGAVGTAAVFAIS